MIFRVNEAGTFVHHYIIPSSELKAPENQVVVRPETLRGTAMFPVQAQPAYGNGGTANIYIRSAESLSYRRG